MASIYEKPVRKLMRDMVEDLSFKLDDVISRERVQQWFRNNYPKIKIGTINAHLIRMSTNSKNRIHYSPKAVEDDLFFQLDPRHFRLYQPERDPTPISLVESPKPFEEDDEEMREGTEYGGQEFAYEKDLQSYLVKNLHSIERGLTLYEDEEDIKGVEFPAGNRYIDILALDKDNNYVVIELKVSKGYDRVVGQLLRYMNWIKKHHAEPQQKVRGVIVARHISEDLILACSGLENVQLYEYEMSLRLHEKSSI